MANMGSKKEIMSSCAGDACCAPSTAAMPVFVAAPLAVAGATVFRIPAMDCAVEESDIRRALDKVSGIRSLNFQLGARTVAINAPADVMPLAIKAIRAAMTSCMPTMTSALASFDSAQRWRWRSVPRRCTSWRATYC